MSDLAATLPLSSVVKPAVQDIGFYRFHVKRMLILVAANGILPQVDPDFLLDTLHRIFRFKGKVIENLAVYTKREVEERGRPLNDTLNNLTFFTSVLFEYVDKNNGQALAKGGLS